MTFSRDIKAVPLFSASRWLVKRGEAMKICIKVVTSLISPSILVIHESSFM
jgi:hypothetical protein